LSLGLAVGLDIGGSWSRAALGGPDGKIIRSIALPVDRRSNDYFLDHLSGLIEKLVDDQMHSIAGIGIGAAGRLDISKGRILFSPHAQLKDVDVSSHVTGKFNKPVVLLNDCVMAALAEKRIGAGVGHKNLVYVGIGTGIGGGIIVDDRVLLGKDGNAHEIGHMIIDMDGRLTCECGGKGHWEAYTSGSGIPKYARLLARTFGMETPLSSRLARANLGSKDFFDALVAGDPFAKHVLEECARLNAMALANLTNLSDPEIIIIGGGVAMKNRKAVVAPLEAEVQKYAFNIPPKVSSSPLGEESPLIGSVLSVFERPFLEKQCP
jgi:glucokinase